jgi:hypothetical protein
VAERDEIYVYAIVTRSSIAPSFVLAGGLLEGLL